MDRQELHRKMEELYATHQPNCHECSSRYPFGTCEEIGDEILALAAKLEEGIQK